MPVRIHDISRTELDPHSRLPRFNMPFELGLFLGAQRFGNADQAGKRVKILDTERYRFHKYLSDIAGQDISAHDGRPDRAIRAFAIGCESGIPRLQSPGRNG